VSDQEREMGYGQPCADGMHNRREPGADRCVCGMKVFDDATTDQVIDLMELLSNSLGASRATPSPDSPVPSPKEPSV
jgi:dihydroxyacetone kinase